MTTESSPPLVGFNNNVRYRGMRFHIQTEDSGVTRPHIVTHLFADGGYVIKSLRTDYSEYIDRPDRPVVIHKMMREQHRAMALDLRDGRLDATIDGLSLSTPPPEPKAEIDTPEPEATQRSPGLGTPAFARHGTAHSGLPLPAASAAPATGVVVRPVIAIAAAGRDISIPDSPRARKPPSEKNVPPSKTLPAPSGVPERTSSSRRGSKTQHSLSAAPPPSAPPSEKRSSSRRRSASSRRPAPAPPEASNRKRRTAPAPASKRPPASSRKGRPAPALPTKPNADSLFGAMPKESLDDAILSYVSSTKGPSTRRPK